MDTSKLDVWMEAQLYKRLKAGGSLVSKYVLGLTQQSSKPPACGMMQETGVVISWSSVAILSADSGKTVNCEGNYGTEMANLKNLGSTFFFSNLAILILPAVNILKTYID